MAKDSFYFQHDFNARNDEKILELRSKFGAEGYGVFWMIIETMAENENGGVKASLMGGLSHGYGVAIPTLKKIISCCIKVGLLHEKDGYLFSNRMLEYKEFRKSQSEFGRRGAHKRWGGHSHPNSLPNGESNAKDRIGKDIIGKDIEVEVGNLESTSDAESLLLANPIQFERICMNARKEAAAAKDSLRKFHLFLQENNRYPQSQKSIFAGFEKWLINEKGFSRSHQRELTDYEKKREEAIKNFKPSDK